ncbi:MAG: hypothetical protein RLZZ299_895 [Pseudomonadota bacterium]
MNAVCVQCGAAKDVPLARCGSCGLLPEGGDRMRSMCASRRMVDAETLATLQRRIRDGQTLDPSPALRARAAALLEAPDATPRAEVLRPGALLVLATASLLVTPLLAWAAWFRWRVRADRRATQALRIALYTSAASTGAWLAWVRAS